MKDLSRKLNVKPRFVETVLKLLEDNTVPFIARYRKEMTGEMDETAIREIEKAYEARLRLQERKEDVIRLIEERGMLTEELRIEIEAADKLIDVEDLYRPYKEKKKTKASEAEKKGLAPLAEALLACAPDADVNKHATAFLNDDVQTIEAAIEGAQHIIAEKVSDNPRNRKWVRRHLEHHGRLVCKKKKAGIDKKRIYETYYEYDEALKHVKLFRILAINRAEKEKILSVSIDVEEKDVLKRIEKRTVKDPESPCAPTIASAIEDAYKRLIKPSVEREIRSMLSERAQTQAIEIFGENLRSLLMQPPMKDKRVLGIDPAFRTGCKLAVVDDLGTFVKSDVVYPHLPAKREEAEKKMLSTLSEYAIDVIAIGNGTASRETEAFIADILKKHDGDCRYVIVNEAGASVYSASELAKSEFPDLAVEERSAVSIARRFQDPLSELVKIEPRSIGVGQYQHDMPKTKLNDALDFIVETVVNQVGVNVNTASVQLLSHVAGLTRKIAKQLVDHRETNGVFRSRSTLLDVEGFGPKTFEQAAGFLRILDGDNPLDKTSIHPESYEETEKILSSSELTAADIGSNVLKETISALNPETVATAVGLGEPTVKDIFTALIAPLRDPRDDVDRPLLKKDLLKLEDLRPGMELQGTVRNVVDFGVFVDCGVKDDGLVHISQLSEAYVKHPLDVVSVGDIVKVWVKDIDLERSRLQLTMVKEKA